MTGKCGMAPSDVRAILEGYCLDQEFVTTLNLTFTAGEATATLDQPISQKMRFARVECRNAIPEDPPVRMNDIEGLTVTLSAEATYSGTFPCEVVSYRQLSDDWLVNARDCQVVPVVKRMTGISFDGPKRIKEFHSGTGSTILILNHRPIREVHSINLITNPQNWVYVSPSSVQPIEEEGLLKLKAVLESWQNYVPAFPRGTDNIQVEYTYGYDDVPCDVKRAVAMLVASQALAMIGSRGGGGSLGVQGFNKNYGQRGKYTDYREELERWAHALLRNYVMGLLGQ